MKLFKLLLLLAVASPSCFGHNMTIELFNARRTPYLKKSGVQLPIIAIVKVNGNRLDNTVGFEWTVTSNDPGCGLGGIQSPTATDECGVTQQTVFGIDVTGICAVKCKWTDPTDPNHTHMGETQVTLVDCVPTTAAPPPKDDCVAEITPMRCNIYIKYLPDTGPLGRQRMSGELGVFFTGAIGRWNESPNQTQIRFFRDDASMTPNITVRDVCHVNDDTRFAETLCPAPPPGDSLKAWIEINTWSTFGDCEDHQSGWCQFDRPRDFDANTQMLAHELGHTLGLMHVFPAFGCIMDATPMSWYECGTGSPAAIEITTLNALYPGTA